MPSENNHEDERYTDQDLKPYDPERQRLLDYIGDDRDLHTLATMGERDVQKSHPDVQPGSEEFYKKVLAYVRNANSSGSWKQPPPPVPSFEAPPSFYCGMEEEK